MISLSMSPTREQDLARAHEALHCELVEEGDGWRCVEHGHYRDIPECPVAIAAIALMRSARDDVLTGMLRSMGARG